MNGTMCVCGSLHVWVCARVSMNGLQLLSLKWTLPSRDSIGKPLLVSIEKKHFILSVKHLFTESRVKIPDNVDDFLVWSEEKQF